MARDKMRPLYPIIPNVMDLGDRAFGGDLVPTERTSCKVNT